MSPPRMPSVSASEAGFAVRPGQDTAGLASRPSRPGLGHWPGIDLATKNPERRKSRASSKEFASDAPNGLGVRSGLVRRPAASMVPDRMPWMRPPASCEGAKRPRLWYFCLRRIPGNGADVAHQARRSPRHTAGRWGQCPWHASCLGQQVIMRSSTTIRAHSTNWLLAGLMALGASPCDAKEASEPFVYAIQGTQVTTLDSLDAQNSKRLSIVSQVMEGLMGINTKNDRVTVPLLARKHQRVDGRTYVFRLRHDITFHPHAHSSINFQNSEQVTAEDVEFSLLRARDSISSGQHLFNKIESVQAITNDLVKIKLSQPDDDLLYSLATNLGHITCKSYYESLGPDNEAIFEKKPIGTGPYRLVEPLDENEPIVLERFKGYHDRRWAYSDTAVEIVEFRFYDDLQQIVDGLRADEIHMTGILLSKLAAGEGFIDLARGRLPVVVKELTPPFLSILAINLDRPYLRDSLIRRLLNSAVDKEKIERVCPQLLDHPEELPKGYRYYLGITQKYLEGDNDLNELLQRSDVQALLTELRQSGPLKLRTDETEDPIRDSMLEVVEEGLKKRLEIEVQRVTTQDDVDDVYDLIYVDWTPDTPAERDELAILYPLFQSNSKTSLSFYSDTEVDELFNQIEDVIDSDTREKLYEGIQEKLLADSPHIWLPSVRSTAMIYQESYELGSGDSILIYLTSFLKDLKRKS